MDNFPDTKNRAQDEHQHDDQHSTPSVTDIGDQHEEHNDHTNMEPKLTQMEAMDHSSHAGQSEHNDHRNHGDHTGHDVHAGHGVMHEGHATMMRNRFWICVPLTLIVLLYSPMIQTWFGFTSPQFPGSQLIGPIIGTIIFIVGGFPFLSMARQEIAIRQPAMMTLISLAITTAYLYSMGIFLFPTNDAMVMRTGGMTDFFWELATLITIMLLGHWIELRSVGQAQGALRELAKLLPDQAERILPDGQTENVTVNQLRSGDRVLIRPGASIPADGVVSEGDSSINEAMITGESKPVDKHTGDNVIGGTVNLSGSLRVEIQQVGESTALAGIMRLVEEAQKSQSRAQTLAQRAAFYLTVVAIIAGILTFIGWIVFTGNVSDAVRFTVGVLIIACPHALGLAVPLVIAISTTLSARNGLLIRKRVALESAKDLNYIIFDKTGTLTKGEQGVVETAATGISADEALSIAAGIEGDSEHIVAEAIRKYAQTKHIQPAQVSNFESLAGRGVKAAVKGATYFVGGPRLLEQQKWTVPAALQTSLQKA
ncbi:MAG: HAD-IC family P-type ATPase, partial [Chloroflexota bacterium]